MTNEQKVVRTELERIISGDLYSAADPELAAKSIKSRSIMEEYNKTSRLEKDKRQQLLNDMFKSVGENITVEAPVYVDYGSNTTIGNNFYANYDCIFLDVAPINIGDNVMFGPPS